jgi:hypothetical protein
VDRKALVLVLKRAPGRNHAGLKQELYREDTHVYSHNREQTIDAIKSWLGNEAFVQYCRGQVIRYLSRMGEKDESVKELRKAEVYLRWARETLEYKELSK